jgi:ligand-binding sensor domain-containing protein/signal transduction histidine kinase
MNKILRILLVLPILIGSSAAIPQVHTDTSTALVDPIQTYDRYSNPRFDHLTVDDGLSQSIVHAILQDSQGYLWFGTENGLNRYDGDKFLIFKSNPADPNSLPDSYITALTEDPSGGIWIGTRFGGLSHYDPSTGEFKNYPHEASDTTSLDSPTVNCLYVDYDNQLLIGTPYGLNIYLPESGTFEHARQSWVRPYNSALNNILSIYRDSGGILWVGTSYGLTSYSFSEGWSNAFFEDLSNNINDENIYNQTPLAWETRGISEDSNNGLWLASNMGISRLDLTTGELTTFRHDNEDPTGLSDQYVYDLLIDTNGTVWIGTKNGLNRYDQNTGSFVHYFRNPQNPYSLSSEVILSIYEDREGILWLGTFGGGVNKLDRNKAKFDLYQSNPDDPSSLSPFPIYGLTEGVDGSIWLATYGGGLDRLDRSTGRVAHYRNIQGDNGSLINDYLWSVFQDHNGNLWVGSEGGLDWLDLDTGLFTHYLPDSKNPVALRGAIIGQIYEDHVGDLWIATSAGLSRFNLDTGLFRTYVPNSFDIASFSSIQPTAIFETQEGDLWIGTNNRGLELYVRKEDEFIHYRHDVRDPTSLAGDCISAILQDSQGSLWVATCGTGLDKMDKESDTFIHYTKQDGLPSNVILGIVEDNDGKLWISTNDGISCFDPSLGTFRNFDISDGLQSNEFDKYAYAKTRDGAIIMGGIDGLNIFQPKQVSDNPYIPPIVLTGISQGGEAINPKGHVNNQANYILGWPNNYFDFEYAAMSFSNPEENQYAYILEPFDKDWIEMGNRRFGRYTNLPGGDYTLKIKGSNNDGVWNDKGLSISVKVIPPFWSSTWFQLSTILIVIGLVFTGYRWRLRNIQSYNRELERQVLERTVEIERLFEKTKELAVIEERNRLARDLHDSVKQKAFAAMAQLGTAQSILSQDPLSARSHLEEAETLVSEVIEELTFLIQEMYPLVLKEKGLMSVLRSYIYEWQDRNSIQVNLEVFNERRIDIQIEQALFRVIQEALSNVARHSNAAKVDLTLHFSKNRIELTIKDNGRGFDKVARMNGVGLQSMQERAHMIYGHLTITTAPGQGTIIRLVVPLRSPILKTTG